MSSGVTDFSLTYFGSDGFHHKPAENETVTDHQLLSQDDIDKLLGFTPDTFWTKQITWPRWVWLLACLFCIADGVILGWILF